MYFRKELFEKGLHLRKLSRVTQKAPCWFQSGFCAGILLFCTKQVTLGKTYKNLLTIPSIYSFTVSKQRDFLFLLISCPPCPKTQLPPAHGCVGMLLSVAVRAATGTDTLRHSAGASPHLPSTDNLLVSRPSGNFPSHMGFPSEKLHSTEITSGK